MPLPHSAVMRSHSRSIALPSTWSIRRALRFVIAVGSMTATACSRSSGDGGSIRIGIAADLKRPNMQTVLRGVELAIDRLNAEGNGRHFETAHTPAQATGAVEIAAALRDDPRVIAGVGTP